MSGFSASYLFYFKPYQACLMPSNQIEEKFTFQIMLAAMFTRDVLIISANEN